MQKCGCHHIKCHNNYEAQKLRNLSVTSFHTDLTERVSQSGDSYLWVQLLHQYTTFKWTFVDWLFLCVFLIWSWWTFWHQRITEAACWPLMMSFRLDSWLAQVMRHQVVRVQTFAWVCGPVLYVCASWSSSSPCLPRWYLAKSFLVTSPITCSRPDTKKCDVRATIIILLITVHWKTLLDDGINPRKECPCEGWKYTGK